MKKKTLLLVVIISLFLLVSCIVSNTKVDVIIAENSFVYEDNKIAYVLVNNTLESFNCYGYGYLEKKIGNLWELVPSTRPNPVAWCGTPGQIEAGKTALTISFMDYNGTLSAGTYRIAISYAPVSNNKEYTAYSKAFTLAGDFPMSAGYPRPANIYLKFSDEALPENPSVINYTIANESGGEVYIYPEITLMLYQNSQWMSYSYDTGAGHDFTSSDKEIPRSIAAENIPGGFENCSKIRIIEKVAIPQRHVFYIFHEISIE